MIYLMRHGQDDETYIGGWSDVLLTIEGIKEIESQAKWIKDNLQIKKIICSSVKRAYDTALIVNKYLNVNLSIDENLKEQNKGLLNGMLKSEATKLYLEFMDNVQIDTVIPKGESLQNLYNRITKYLDKLYKLEDNTLIITHRGVINMIYYYLNNIDLDMDKKKFDVTHASIHELDCKNKLIKKIK